MAEVELRIVILAMPLSQLPALLSAWLAFVESSQASNSSSSFVVMTAILADAEAASARCSAASAIAWMTCSSADRVCVVLIGVGSSHRLGAVVLEEGIGVAAGVREAIAGAIGNLECFACA